MVVLSYESKVDANLRSQELNTTSKNYLFAYIANDRLNEKKGVMYSMSKLLDMKNILLLLLLITGYSYAQHSIDIKSNILNQVDASRVMKTTSDFNLKGNVASLVEVNATQNDTLLQLIFDEQGRCLHKQEAKFKTDFTYKQDALEQTYSIRSEYPYDTTYSTFNKGQLTKTVSDYMSQYEPEQTIRHFNYQKGFEHITITFDYSFDKDRWDVALQDDYYVKFDSLGRVTNVKNENEHKEYTYVDYQSYSYDAKGRITGVKLVDKDAGSNSALDVWMTISYNDSLHIRMESLYDHTVRNSMWSYGYDKYERFNENGDLIQERFTRHDQREDMGFYLDKKTAMPELEPKYTYIYDQHGNWVVKNFMLTDTPVEIAKRTITYFD